MSANIKVMVRPRPCDEGKKEKWAQGFEIHGRRITLGAKTYDPDVTLQATSTQEEVFEQCVPILDSVKDGVNGTIMVYGQTGTGKTHTMLGSCATDKSGVAYKSVEYLLNHVQQATLSGRQISLSLSMFEIYNEKVNDMLHPDGDKAPEVQLLNGCPRQPTVRILTNVADAIQLITKCLSCRHISTTAMNDRSSRSHVIVALDLEEVIGERAEATHLSLVDLAGSESIKKSQAVGKVASEAGMINRSLLALKSVILALSNVSSEGPKPHAPYRDSKLTEMLQDSIGGSARTMFIACISPNGRDIEETKSTLEYASKARSIRNVTNTERDILETRCRSLQVELLKCKNKLQDKVNERGGYWVTKEEHEEAERKEERSVQLEAEMGSMMAELKSMTAKQHVCDGQTAMFKELLKLKEGELQQSKEQYVALTSEFQKKADDMLRDHHTRCTAVEKAAQKGEEAFRASLVDWKEQVTSPQFRSRFVTEVSNTCASINSAATTSMRQVGTVLETLHKQWESDHNQSIARSTEQLRELSKMVVGTIDSLLKKQQAEQEEARALFQLAAASASNACSKAPPVAHTTPFEHVIDNMLAEVVSSGEARMGTCPSSAAAIFEDTAAKAARDAIVKATVETGATLSDNPRGTAVPLPLAPRVARATALTPRENIQPQTGVKRSRSSSVTADEERRRRPTVGGK